MIGVLFIGSYDVCIGYLLTLEVELHEEHIREVESSASVLEGKCNMSSLVTQ
jgi:hypothetical protein